MPKFTDEEIMKILELVEQKIINFSAENTLEEKVLIYSIEDKIIRKSTKISD